MSIYFTLQVSFNHRIPTCKFWLFTASLYVGSSGSCYRAEPSNENQTLSPFWWCWRAFVLRGAQYLLNFKHAKKTQPTFTRHLIAPPLQELCLGIIAKHLCIDCLQGWRATIHDLGTKDQTRSGSLSLMKTFENFWPQPPPWSTSHLWEECPVLGNAANQKIGVEFLPHDYPILSADEKKGFWPQQPRLVCEELCCFSLPLGLCQIIAKSKSWEKNGDWNLMLKRLSHLILGFMANRSATSHCFFQNSVVRNDEATRLLVNLYLYEWALYCNSTLSARKSTGTSFILLLGKGWKRSPSIGISYRLWFHDEHVVSSGASESSEDNGKTWFAGIGCIQHANPASNMKHQEHCLIILSSFPCLFDLDVGLSPKMHFHREAMPATAHQSCWHFCVLVPVNGLAKLPHGIRSKMVYTASQYAKKGDNHRLADKHALCKSFYMCLRPSSSWQ